MISSASDIVTEQEPQEEQAQDVAPELPSQPASTEEGQKARKQPAFVRGTPSRRAHMGSNTTFGDRARVFDEL